jgi:hypothetical protein
MTCLSCNGNHPNQNIFLKYKFIYIIRNNDDFWRFFFEYFKINFYGNFNHQ